MHRQRHGPARRASLEAADDPLAAAAALLVSHRAGACARSAGPSVFDRVQAANTVGTCAMVLLAVIGFLNGRPDFLDLAMVYGLLNVIGTIAVLKFFRYGGLGEPGNARDERRSWKSSAAACLLAGGFFCVVGAIGLAAHARLLYAHACRQRDRDAGRRAAPARPAAAGRLDADGAKLVMLGLLIFFASPTATPCAGARRIHARAEAGRLCRRRNRHRNADHQRPAAADGGRGVRARAHAQSVRRHRAGGHLQLPDGRGAGRAGRGRRGHDRSVGRRRHLHRAAAERAGAMQQRGSTPTQRPWLPLAVALTDRRHAGRTARSACRSSPIPRRRSTATWCRATCRRTRRKPACPTS